MTQDMEVEAKFSITDPGQLTILCEGDALFNHYLLSTVEQVSHIDTYFDTADLRLLRNGQTLRLRRVDGQLLATTKSIDLNTPKGVHTRTEIERPVGDDELWDAVGALDVARLPVDVVAALQDVLPSSSALHPLCRLEQARAKRLLTTQHKVRGRIRSSPLAELSVDQVTVFQPHSKAESAVESWRRVGEFDELEIELIGAAPKQELKQLAVRMREMPGLTPNWQNKLQQALALMAAPAATAEAYALRHMAELCRSVWRQQLTVMLMNEAGVRFSDDIEYIHDMRVATRRARAAARLYVDFFQADAVASFVKRLRTTGRLLGAVRDLDVAVLKVDNYRSAEASEQDGGLDRLSAEWRSARAKAHADLLRWLDSRKYRRFVAEFSAFCQTPGAGVKPFVPKPGRAPAPHQVRHVIPSMLMSRFEAVRAFEVLFERDERVPAETLHALRIECKYLRYHLEFASSLLGAEGGELIEALRQLQEHLGDLNDASVTEAMLAGKQKESTEVERYRGKQKSLLNELGSRLPVDLAAFLSAETRRKLALALARI